MSIIQELITDRAQADVNRVRELALKGWTGMTTAEQTEWAAGMKGAYNYTDLNRVTQAMDYINNQLVGYGYATGYQKIKIPRKGGGRLPEGYTELEYIQSSGTQYIDTGFKPNQDTRVVINVTDVSASSGIASLFGGRTANGVSSFSMWAFSSVVRTDYGANILKTTQPYATVQSIDKNKNITILNGTEYTQTYSTFQAGVSLTLFAVNDGEIGVDTRMVSMCLYSCQIYDNGTLIRDYVPAKNSSGIVGLYDVVNGVFYTNAGTGEFAAGPVPVQLPDGYTQIEYIQSTGTQYISIPYSIVGDVLVKCRFQLIESSGSNQIVLGGADVSFRYLESSNRFAYYRGGTSSLFDTDIKPFVEHLLTISDSECHIDDDVRSSSTSYKTQPAFFLCAYRGTSGNASNFSIARIWSCTVTNGQNVVCEMIPCIGPNGDVGLYDIINNVFYQNAGTGTFTAGPEVEAEPEVEEEELDPYIWYESDIPTVSLMTAYLSNVEAIRSTLEVMSTTPETPESMEALTWVEANNIEQILLDVQMVIDRVVNGMARSNSFTFWSGNRPFPTAESNLGRTWAELDAMETEWANWEVATWYLLLYGNLEAEGVVT